MSDPNALVGLAGADDIDLNFRPISYFGPQRLQQHLLSSVKGAVLRSKLEALFAQGRHAEVKSLLADPALSLRDRMVLERFQPMFMGGNYLPDNEKGEVEVARIRINSTTYDVTSVLAKAASGKISLRVVDEYDGDTLRQPSVTRRGAPLPLKNFTDFFLKSWSLINVLKCNYPGDLEAALGFFTASSAFYPQLDSLCRLRVRESYQPTQEALL